MQKKGSAVEQAIKDRAEVDIHEGRKKLNEDLKVIEGADKSRRNGMEKVGPLVMEGLEDKNLNFLEGYTLAIEHQSRAKDIFSAMALYYICKNERYKDGGFDNFSDYCVARGLNKSAAYEWVKNIETFGTEAFPVLVERVGLNRNFFREIKALPEEVKDAVVKGEVVEVNGKEYDLAKGGKGLREMVKALVHDCNKAKQEVQSRYDTSKQYKEKLAKKEAEIKSLKEQMDNAGLPKEDQEALDKIRNLKVQLRGVIRIIETADVRGYSEEVREELLLLAQYAHDRGEVCLGRILESLKGESYAPGREEAEREFREAHGEDAE